MKKLARAALLAVSLAVPASALAATTASAATSQTSTGSAAYQRCRAAGGTDHFCYDLGGYWYFTS